MTEFKYLGEELALFQHARNWKAYFGSLIEPYIGESVLEVGAGNGATTQALVGSARGAWTCLEPDPALAALIRERIAAGDLPSYIRVATEDLKTLDDAEKFDTILYIDVLEHIDDDASELRRAAEHLILGGHLVVVSPAYQALYSPFDAAIGHVRRYDRRSLAAAAPNHLRTVRLSYLDSVGALASLGNKLLLRQSYPTLDQILLWDRRLVPISRVIDKILFHRTGKSILGIWQKLT
jgi:SAM-dependent methyltransferase